MMEPGAKYVTGKSRPGGSPFEMDKSFIGLVQLGAIMRGI
jgi:hypothetical protein